MKLLNHLPILAGLVLAALFSLIGIGDGVSLLDSPALPLFMLGITAAAELQQNKMFEAAIKAFNEVLLPLRAFSTVFYNVPLEGTNKIAVPYYGLTSTATRNFDGSYVFDSESMDSREVTVDRRKYQSLSYTSADLVRKRRWDPEEFGRMKAQKLAEDTLTDILGLITAANYPEVAFTGAASSFDSDDLIDMKEECDQAKWPKLGRSVIYDTTYETYLLKDNDVKTSPSMNITEEALREGRVPRLAGFDLFATNVIPDNSEYLKGMAVFKSALLVAFSPIEPAPEIRKNLTRYEILTQDNGIALEYREWGSPDSDAVKRVFEVNYGRGVGEANALLRIRSQSPE